MGIRRRIEEMQACSSRVAPQVTGHFRLDSLARLTSFPFVAYAPSMTQRLILGPAVKAIREAYGIKQSDLAIRCDITPGFLSNVEAGRKQPSPHKAREIAQRLGVPLDAITYVVTEQVAA